MIQNLGFIGTGHMGCAMISGILQSKLFTSNNLFVYDINQKLYLDL